MPDDITQPPWEEFYDRRVPRHCDYPEVPLPGLLRASAAAHPRRPALGFFGRTVSYAALDELSDRCAAGLRRLGVRKGTPVSIHLPNCPQFVIAYYGILKAGGIVVPHNPLYTEPEIAYQLEDASVQIAVTLDLMYPRVAPAAQRSGVRTIVVTSINEFMPPLLRRLYPLKARREGHRVRIPRDSGIQTFASVLQYSGPGSGGSPQGREPAEEVSSEDAALYQYTGGTTGTPKAAVLTHRNLVCNAVMAAAWDPDLMPGQERALAVLPFFHIYGMTAVLNTMVRLGGMVILVPRFDIGLVVSAIRKYRPTIFHGVPTMYMALMNDPRLKGVSLGSIRGCISGAMALPLQVQESWERLTAGRLVEGYGLTEASPITHCTPIAGTRKIGSIGIPFPDTDARIADPQTGATLPIGEVGELAVRGPQVMAGYLDKPEETAAVLRDDWLFTGDMARMDDDGFFYIVDRRKEMINVGGLKVFPREVEEVLYQHPAVREAAAVGIADPLKGERVKAFVALRAGASVGVEDIVAFCRARLAPHKVPRDVEVRDKLPKTLIGKILRRALAEEERTGARAEGPTHGN